MYDAGLWTAQDATDPRLSTTFPDQWRKTPVCANFQNVTGNVNVAEAQAQPPAIDVYLNTKKDVAKRFLRQSTILHEVLHNLTGLRDGNLQIFLGLPDTASQGGSTDVINRVLEDNTCALKQ
jgi:hypothetical protein